MLHLLGQAALILITIALDLAIVLVSVYEVYLIVRLLRKILPRDEWR